MLYISLFYEFLSRQGNNVTILYMDIHTLRRQFIENLEIELGRSPKTTENYDHCLEHFFAWANIHEPKDISLQAVRKYRLFLNRKTLPSGETLSRSTQNHQFIVLRTFLKFLAKRDIPALAAEKVEIGKTEGRQVEFLEPSEIERLLTVVSGVDTKSLRDRAILELLFSSGLRVSELVHLDRNHVNLEKQEFSVRGKGGKVRLVFLSESAREALEKYLKKRLDVDPALFIAPSKGFAPKGGDEDLRLTPRTVQRLVKHYAQLAGIVKDVHPHTLRHSFATDLLSNGADIRSVQAMLGHSSITTTQVYTHVTDKHLKEVHKAFHGRQMKKKKS